MKLKCVKCELMKEKGKEQIQTEFGTAEDTIMPVELLEIFTKKGGKCTDGKRHVFVFSEDFTDEVQKLKENINIENKEIETDNRTINTAKEVILDMQKQIAESEKKLKDSQIYIERTNDIVTKRNLNIEDMKGKFEDITGTKDVEIWK